MKHIKIYQAERDYKFDGLVLYGVGLMGERDLARLYAAWCSTMEGIQHLEETDDIEQGKLKYCQLLNWSRNSYLFGCNYNAAVRYNRMCAKPHWNKHGMVRRLAKLASRLRTVSVIRPDGGHKFAGYAIWLDPFGDHVHLVESNRIHIDS